MTSTLSTQSRLDSTSGWSAAALRASTMRLRPLPPQGRHRGRHGRWGHHGRLAGRSDAVSPQPRRPQLLWCEQTGWGFFGTLTFLYSAQPCETCSAGARATHELPLRGDTDDCRARVVRESPVHCRPLAADRAGRHGSLSPQNTTFRSHDGGDWRNRSTGQGDIAAGRQRSRDTGPQCALWRGGISRSMMARGRPAESKVHS